MRLDILAKRRYRHCYRLKIPYLKRNISMVPGEGGNLKRVWHFFKVLLHLPFIFGRRIDFSSSTGWGDAGERVDARTHAYCLLIVIRPGVS